MISFYNRIKIFFVLIAVFFILSQIVFIMSPTVFSRYGKYIAPVILFPTKVFYIVYYDAKDTVDNYFFIKNTRKIMKRIIKENKTLYLRIAYLEEKNHLQKEILKNVKYFLPETFGVISEYLIGRDPNFLFDSVIIDANDGRIVEGTAVMSYQGVVGMVVQKFPFSAKVMLLTNYNSSIDVINKRSRIMGVFKGSGNMQGEVLYVPVNNDVRKGDIWITTGLGGVYPKGISVAVTVNMKRIRKNPFIKIIAKPTVNIFKLENVILPVRYGKH